MSHPWPDPDVLADIYHRLAGGDPTAPGDLAEAVDPLTDHLRRHHPAADDHALWTAAADAVLSVIRNPAVFDPSRGPLRSFLCMAAEGDYLNLFKKEKRHHAKRETGDCVELPDPAGNPLQELDADGPSFDDPAVAAEIAALPPADRSVFELMRGGEKRTAAFAPVLGVAHLPPEDQAREVKRAKDRIVKRLQRAGGK